MTQKQYLECSWQVELPKILNDKIQQLIVARHGIEDEAHMVTRAILGHVSDNINYRLTLDGFVEETGNSRLKTSRRPEIFTTNPPFLKLTGQWLLQETRSQDEANILGGFGEFIVSESELKIPETLASIESLAFYGAKLIKVGDSLQFDTLEPMPVTVMDIGKNYVNSYLLQEKLGGGNYIEHHNKPHFHMPLDPEAKGHIILGKKHEGAYYFTAFRVPYGYGIYTSPHVIHSDAHLIGQYLIVYSTSESFSSVILKNKQHNMARIFIC